MRIGHFRPKVFGARVIIRGGKQCVTTVIAKGQNQFPVNRSCQLANGQLSKRGFTQCASVSLFINCEGCALTVKTQVTGPLCERQFHFCPCMCDLGGLEGTLQSRSEPYDFMSCRIKCYRKERKPRKTNNCLGKGHV